jgi:hypothetical protein
MSEQQDEKVEIPEPKIDFTTKHWSREEVLSVAANLKASARARFFDTGEHRPIAYLFCTKHPETGEQMKAVSVMPNLGTFDEEGKQQFNSIMKVLALGAGAEAILFISEVWMVHSEGKSREEAEALMREYAGRLGEHPDRIEQLMITLDHRKFGNLMWTAQILRDDVAKDKPRLGPWKGTDEWPRAEGSKGKMQFEGRFINLLPPPWEGDD